MHCNYWESLSSGVLIRERSHGGAGVLCAEEIVLIQNSTATVVG